MADETRVVLVKPGDALVFGNVGESLTEDLEEAAALIRERLGLKVVVLFSGDVHMAVVPRG